MCQKVRQMHARLGFAQPWLNSVGITKAYLNSKFEVDYLVFPNRVFAESTVRIWILNLILEFGWLFQAFIWYCVVLFNHTFGIRQ